MSAVCSTNDKETGLIQKMSLIENYETVQQTMQKQGTQLGETYKPIVEIISVTAVNSFFFGSI